MDSSSTLSALNWIDVGSLAVMLMFAVAGAFKGAIRIVMGFVTMSAAWWLSGRFGGNLGLAEWALFQESDLEQPRHVATLVECALVFVGVLLLGGFLARLLRKAAESVALGGFDRAIALAMGVAMGALVAAAATVGLMAVDHKALWPTFESSVAVSLLRDGVDEAAAAQWIDEPMHVWLEDVLSKRPT